MKLVKKGMPKMICAICNNQWKKFIGITVIKHFQ